MDNNKKLKEDPYMNTKHIFEIQEVLRLFSGVLNRT